MIVDNHFSLQVVYLYVQELSDNLKKDELDTKNITKVIYTFFALLMVVGLHLKKILKKF